MIEGIVVLAGDGIGKEVTRGAIRVLQHCIRRQKTRLALEELPIGGQALDEYGEPLPQFVLDSCLETGVVLLGAVGDPRFDDNPHHLRPERALLGLRKELQLFANLRPVKTQAALLDSSTLKRGVVEGVDLLIVRELTGGIYFGEPRGLQQKNGVRVGLNTEIYSDWEISRIARVAFEASQKRSAAVTSIDKSNVLESSQLWRQVVNEVSAEYPDVRLDHMLVDNCAMQLIARPASFDVLLTNNMFGDILSDEAAMLTGSIGMLPSASLGDPTTKGHRVGLYEPVHGAAPDIAGKDQANPLAAIGCASLMLRHSLDKPLWADQIDQAIENTLNAGYRTADIAGPESQVVGTSEMVDRVLEQLDHLG